jgi:hypothetical protein
MDWFNGIINGYGYHYIFIWYINGLAYHEQLHESRMFTGKIYDYLWFPIKMFP